MMLSRDKIRPMTDIPLKIGIILLVLALPFWGFGINSCINTANFAEHAVRTEATVVEVVKKESKSDSDVWFHPVLLYVDKQGEEHRVESNVSTSTNRYVIGQTMEVLYDPDDPQEMTLGSATAVWVGPIVLFTLAAFLTITGVLLVVLIPRLIRRKQKTWEDARDRDDPDVIFAGDDR